MSQGSPVLTELNSAEATATFVVSPVAGNEEFFIRVAFLRSELEAFQTIFSGKPFGAKQHKIELHGFTLGEGSLCKLRSSLEGSRKDHWVPVSTATLDGLQYVFHRFALDPELVPEKPGAVLQEAPNPSIERTSPGKPGLASHAKR